MMPYSIAWLPPPLAEIRSNIKIWMKCFYVILHYHTKILYVNVKVIANNGSGIVSSSPIIYTYMLLDATTIIYYIYILYIIYTGMTPVNAQSNSIACLTLTTCQVGQVSTTFDHECTLRIPVVPCQTLLASWVGTPWVHMGTHKVNLAMVCNVTSDPSEILFELNSRKISLVHSLFCDRRILLKFCTEHGSTTAVLCAKFHITMAMPWALIQVCSTHICMVQCTHLITTCGTPHLNNRGSSMLVNSLHSGENDM